MRSKTFLFGLLLAACALWTTPAARADDDCDNPLSTPAHAIGTTGITGSGNLCIDEDDIRASMRVHGLTPGNAYTVWFVVFDNPADCGNYPGGTPGSCTSSDAVLPSNNPEAAFGRMDALVAGESGNARLTGHFRDLRLSHGAIVWFLMFGHGPAVTTDNRELARQLQTPQKPALGAPGLGASGDTIQGSGVALAIFKVP